MKKLMMLAVGLGLVLGSVSFAQDDKKMDDKKMDDKKMEKKAKKGKRMKKAKTTDTDKKM